jgi:hypothetical protein
MKNTLFSKIRKIPKADRRALTREYYKNKSFRLMLKQNDFQSLAGF